MNPPSAHGDAARFSLSVQPPAARSEIVVGRGVLDGLPDLLERHAPAPRYVVVSDDTVAPLHGRPVLDRIEAAGLAGDLITVPAGEVHKRPDQWAALVEELGRMHMGRDGCLIAVGGGVTGDLAGFAAATYARGIALVQVPTTLLAMVDAAIGGKTGIDLAAGKNLAGAWHNPRLVVADPEALQTLPAGVLRQGLAEAVKHGAIADVAYLGWIEEGTAGLIDRDPDCLERLVAGSVTIKTDIVGRDPLEGGERVALNFGHTLGHAFEQASDFTIAHGDAVAVGMVAEARLGERLGITAPGTADRLTAILTALELPVGWPPTIDVEHVIRATRSDKKARRGVVRCTLLRAPGTVARAPDGAWTHPVPDRVLRPALEAFRAAIAGPGNGP